MARSTWILGATLAFSVAACGSGVSTDGSSGTNGNQQAGYNAFAPGGNTQQPSGNPQSTASETEASPDNPNQASSSGSPSAGSDCVAMCTRASSAYPCMVGDSSCEAGCAEMANSKCGAENLALWACGYEAQAFVCDGTNFSINGELIMASCEREVRAFQGCDDVQTNPPPPQECTPGNCGTCPEVCSECICNTGDAVACSEVCAAAG